MAQGEEVAARRQRVLKAIGDMIKPQHLDDFFNDQNPALDGERPVDLLATEEGTQRVLSLIEAVATGSFL